MVEPAVNSRTCPVCDESVPADSKRCPHCSTDLTLFAHDGEDIESDNEDFVTVNGDNPHVGELLKAANGDVFEKKDEPVVEDTSFECPECHGTVQGDANSCPNCGVHFSDEEVLECPLCKTLVDKDTDKCPNCGAEFVDGEGEEAPVVPDGEPAEPTVAETAPPKELSFAERMKAEKDASKGPAEKSAAEQPQKELSFAERMKAEKDVSKGPAEKSAAEQPQKELSFAERMKAMKEGKELPKPVVQEKVPGVQESVKEEPTAKQVVAPAPEAARKPDVVAEPTPEAAVTPVTETATSPVMESTGPKPVPKERYKELPALIGIVKKRLALAKRCNIDVSKSRALINQAVAAGKKKDLDTAIRLVEEGKVGIESSVSEYLGSKFQNLSARVAEIKKSGRSVPDIERAITSIQKNLKAGDFEKAYDELEKSEMSITDTMGEDFVDAKSQFKKIEEAIADADILSMDIGEARKLYDEAKQALELEDWNSVSLYSKQGMENLMKVLPDKISNEMKKAKNNLLEIKMMNINISQPVEYLKQANTCVREGKYTEALHSIREFKDYLQKENFIT